MDEQSFRLLMSKLESIEASQQQMYLQFNERMDKHDELFAVHIADDKKMSDHIISVEKEITFAKGVAYVLSGGTAFAAWVSGAFKP